MASQAVLHIRVIEAGDAEAVTRLSAELGYPADSAQVAARIRRILELAEHCAFVALLDYQPVAWMHLFVNYPIESAPYAEIGGLVVADGQRGQGIGRRLVETARQWTRERGLERLQVRCQTRRDDAHRFYRAAGFRENKTQTLFSLALPPEPPPT